MESDKNYVEILVNTVAKILVEAFENLTIEDVNMYQVGYNKAIDDVREKLLDNGFIFTEHALNVFDEIAKQLKNKNQTLESKSMNNEN